MTNYRFKLECPECRWIYNAVRPNGSHPVASLIKPEDDSFDGTVIEELHDCRNPKCRQAFSVYWFEPKQISIEA